MNIIDIIAKKRDRQRLTPEEIQFFIDGICVEEIEEGQTAALLMAIYLQGMTSTEIATLTRAMAFSGETLDLEGIAGIKVDKHSTGGVGDKTSLILIPLIAACGLRMSKLSGKALGHTGGTLDKLSTFSGINLDLPISKMRSILERTGAFITGQTQHMVPADKILYALRDKIACVSSIPLIASSIMSKKIAAGADYILLDVKVGSGAMFADPLKSKVLATEMVRIGKSLGRSTRAVLTSMSQPLGMTVGNAVEVREAIQTLQGDGPPDLVELCFELGNQLLQMTQTTNSKEESFDLLQKQINSGLALQKLRDIVTAQGGDTSCIDSLTQIPISRFQLDIHASSQGYISRLEARLFGQAAMTAMSPPDSSGALDLAAGIVLHKKVGDPVNKDETVLSIFGDNEDRLTTARDLLATAVDISSTVKESNNLIINVLD